MQSVAVNALTTQVLSAIRVALAREAHVLQAAPQLLWQQLYNRLEWEGQSIRDFLKAEFDRRSELGAPPWFRFRSTPPNQEWPSVPWTQAHPSSMM